MALYDNKYWLLSHIRNSFISTDDTGMCELIMAGEESLRKHVKQRFDYYPDEDDSDEDDLSHESYDLQLDIDFTMPATSNSASRLEKIDQSRKKISRMKHIKWETNKTALTQEQIDEMFVRKEPEEKRESQSLFSKTFKQYRTVPNNPFIEHAKFDGSGQVNVPTKKFKIFLTMLPEHQRNYPISICCLGSAKISDLIGLILLKSSTAYEDYTWKSISSYGLYIVEDDGEVDRDFPCLDARENISKFGFPCLGLVEHTDLGKTVTFGSSETVSIRKTFEDNMDKKSKESKVDQEKQQNADLLLLDVHKKSMEAPLYKSYQVNMINKMRSTVHVHLGISGEKIEINQIQKNSKFTLVKQKPVNCDMTVIAGCETVDVKSNKTTFRIIYSPSLGNPSVVQESVSSFNTPEPASPGFKSYEFDADHPTAEEIIHKINHILELRSSDVRKEYLAAQERKFYKKNAFI